MAAPPIVWWRWSPVSSPLVIKAVDPISFEVWGPNLLASAVRRFWLEFQFDVLEVEDPSAVLARGDVLSIPEVADI